MTPDEILKAFKAGKLTKVELKTELKTELLKLKRADENDLGSIQEIISAYKEGKLSTVELKQRIKLFKEASSQPTYISTKSSLKPTAIPENEDIDYYRDSLAVIGISCNFPEATDHYEFWQNLKKSKESVSFLTKDDLRELGAPKEAIDSSNYIAMASSLENKAYFDPDFFNISWAEAEVMDPQARHLLMHSWGAVEDAGYLVENLANTSVYVSSSNSYYHALQSDIGLNTSIFKSVDSYRVWLHAQGGTAATLISYKLGLCGPSLFVHSNCSSSLSALDLAFSRILNGESTYALVGASTMFPSTDIGYQYQAGLNFSSDGHLKAFDVDADGMIPGEGVGVILLKNAAQARADNDHVYSIIRGVGINNDGEEKIGFFAPSVVGQSQVIERLLIKTDIKPDTIEYIETHGTGTKLGDAVELMALRQAYNKFTSEESFCGLGSVKSNIGHLDTAAGIAGLIKISLSIYNQALVPNINFNLPNPEFNLENSPFYVIDEYKRWEYKGRPRRAALSSFGIGGTNTHAILEQYVDEVERTNYRSSDTETYIVPLSAKNKERLQVYAKNLLRYLNYSSNNSGNDSTVFPWAPLSDIAYTLQIGRQAMDSRLVFAVHAREELVKGLEDFLAGKEKIKHCYRGEKEKKRNLEPLFDNQEDLNDFLLTWVKKNKLNKVAQLWAQEGDIDWDLLYGETKPRRVSLPTYPFAKQRHWIPETKNLKIQSTSQLTHSVLHPLLHKNTSNFSEQRYSSTFTGHEFFLADHVLDGLPLLPGVAYLEMALNAVMQTVGEDDLFVSKGGVEIRNIVWLRPFIVENYEAALHISLLPGDNDVIFFEVYDGNGDDERQVFCQGEVRFITSELRRTDLKTQRNSCNEATWPAEECYRRLFSAGFGYGSAFQGIEALYIGDGQVMAKIQMPSGVKDTLEEYLLHPSILDAALQSTIGLMLGDQSDQTNKTMVPFALNQFQVFGRLKERMFAVVRRSEGSRAKDIVQKLDIDLCDEDGSVCVQIKGYSSRLLDRSDLTNRSDALETEMIKGGLVQSLGAPVVSSMSLYQPVWAQGFAANSVQVEFVARWAILIEPDSSLFETLSTNLSNTHCVQLWSRKRGIDGRFQDYASQILQRLKHIIDAKPKGNVLIQIVVAQSQLEYDEEQAMYGALCGLLKSAQLESSKLKGQLIEFAEEPNVALMTQALGENSQMTDGVHIRYSEGSRQSQGWEALPATEESIVSSPFKKEGVYLITGGAGGLGMLFAEDIVRDAPQSKVILAGRSTLSDSRLGEFSKLAAWATKQGCSLDYQQTDVANLDSVVSLIQYIESQYGALSGIIHGAGTLRDSLISQKQASDLHAVLAPKVLGLVNLDQASQQQHLDFFALFSSVSSAFGNAGQADYAAANAFMDEFSSYRNKLLEQGERYGHCVSINWPLWRSGGMNIAPELEARITRDTGVIPITTDAGLNAFKQALQAKQDQVLVLYGDQDTIQSKLLALTPEGSLTDQLIEPVVATSFVTAPFVAEPIVAATADADQDAVLSFIRQTIATAVQAPLEKIQPEVPFEKFGLDSILQVTVIQLLEKVTGTLPKTLLFEYTTAQELQEYFLEHHANKFVQPDTSSVVTNSQKERLLPASENQPRRSRLQRYPEYSGPRDREETLAASDIAIIGMSGRYPESGNINTFWENLKNGKNCISTVTSTHWHEGLTGAVLQENIQSQLQPKAYNGGFLENRDSFDHHLFGMTEDASYKQSPEVRLFLETVWETFEDAGYNQERIKSLQSRTGKGVGVYVGSMYNQYAWHMPTLEDALTYSNGSEWQIANRVSHFFDLKGPSMAVNSACSSSLTAIHLACESLKLSNSSMMLAGGVNLTLDPSKYTLLQSIGFLEQGEQSRSFGQAEGYVPGEGVGAVLLKSLATAIADGDQILGVIKGSFANHGGGRQMYSVPDPQQQSQVIVESINQAGIDPRSINYVESAANGSPLGDPIEMVALNKAFKQFTDQKQFCAIGSVKSNMGHLEAASGISQLSKVLLQLRHNTLVPTINAHPINPDIALDETAFYLQETLAPWEPVNDPGSGDTLPRRCLINSFGAGGAYTNLIIEAYPEIRPVAGNDNVRQEYAFLFSAKSKWSLEEYLRRIKAFLNNNDGITASEIALTLTAVNHNLDYRLAIVAGSTHELMNKISWFTKPDGSEQPDGLYSNENNPQEAAVQTLGQHCQIWAAGENVEVNAFKLDRSTRFYRVFNFPKYAFDYGLNAPLLTELFNYDEPFLRDHTVFNERMIIGATYGSLATNAFFDRHPDDNAVEIQSLQFIEPVTLDEGQRVEISIIDEQNDKDGPFQVQYRFEPEGGWISVAKGRFSPLNFEHESRDVGVLKTELNVYSDVEGLYQGSSFVVSGKSFRTITELYVGTDQALARVVLTADSLQEAHAYYSHPLITYSGFVAVMTLLKERLGDSSYLPFGVNSIQVLRAHQLTSCWVHTWLVKVSPEIILYNAVVIDDHDQIVARFNGCSFKRLRSLEKATGAPAMAYVPRAATTVNIKSAVTISSKAEGGLRLAIQRYLIAKVETLFPHVSGSLTIDMNLMDLGLESNQLIKLTSSIEQEAKIRLTATLLFEYTNINELSEHFSESNEPEFSSLLVEGQPEQTMSTSLNTPSNSSMTKNVSAYAASNQIARVPTPNWPDSPIQSSPVQSNRQSSRDIAIIGMHGRFSGAEGLDQFWDNIANEVNLIEEVPSDHWDIRSWFNEDPDVKGMTYCKWGSFIKDVDKFDAMFFKISPREAEMMDPQGRLLLESVYSAAEDSGYVKQLKGSNTGVFIASSPMRYSERFYGLGLTADPYSIIGNVPAGFANRVSFVFNLNGPSQTIDTACSSALTVLYQACESLRNDECPMAVVGGANLLLSSQHYCYFSSLGALSRTGRCHTFDVKADGYTPGECVGSIILKPLLKAEQDGDRVHAVIKGGAALHGGYTPSLTAPSVRGEENVIVQAWKDAGIDPESLGYIEAHGTGTQLGDPIEIHALNNAFKRYTEKQGFCAVGSAKANIGHTENASGISGVLKVIQQFKHKQIPALPAFEQLNPNIEMAHSALYINEKPQEWKSPAGVPRRAGISAFGFTGGFAHVVLEEYLPKQAVSPELDVSADRPALIILSAKNKDRLQVQVQRLFDSIQQQNLQDEDLAAMAYTLQVGREVMQCRLVLMVTSIVELSDKLNANLKGNINEECVFFGQSMQQKTLTPKQEVEINEAVENGLESKHAQALAELWSQGANIDWERLYRAKTPQILSLPTYPFAKDRHWIPEASNKSAVEKLNIGRSALHPFLHESTPDLSWQRFTSTFSGNEFFLNDHKVNAEKVFPGVGYLEMARAAVEKATNFLDEEKYIALKNVVWSQPLVVNSSGKGVSIGLFEGDQNEIHFEVYTDSKSKGEPVIHSQGIVEFKVKETVPTLEIGEIERRMDQGILSAERCYQAFKTMGMNYGRGHQGIQEIHKGEHQVLAKLSLPASIQETLNDYVLHPSIMDAALQSSIGLVLDPAGLDNTSDLSDKPMLPFAVASVDVIRPCTVSMYAWVRYSRGNIPSNKVQKLNIDLCDDQGHICVKIKGFTSRVLDKALGQELGTALANDPIASLVAKPVWKEKVITLENVEKAYSEHLVFLCGMPSFEEKGRQFSELESMVSGCQCQLLESNQKTVDALFTDYAVCIFEIVREVLKRKPAETVLIQVIVPNTEEYAPLAALSGLLKTSMLENPKLVGQVILVDADDSLENLAVKLQENKKVSNDSVIKYTSGQRLCPTWKEISESESKSDVIFKDRGVYLITGGLGALGVLFAKEILEKVTGAKIILTGRAELSAQKESLLQTLQTEGQYVEYHAIDVCNLEQVCSLLESIQSLHGKLDGIVHSAGVISDNFILNKTEEEFRKVLHPKITGTQNLDIASQDIALDFFVLFSSISAVMGNVGQADYATANAFMDHFAQRRHQRVKSGQRHGQTVSINWPLWQDGGMTVTSASEAIMTQTTGMVAMQSKTGLQAFYQSLALNEPQIMVAEGSPTQLRSVLFGQQQDKAQAGPLVEPFVALKVDLNNLEEKATQYLKTQLSSVFKLPAHQIDAGAALEDYGMDSVLAISLTNRLEQIFGSLPKTLFFEYQTLAELTAYLIQTYESIFTTLLKEELNVTNDASYSDTRKKRRPRLSNIPVLGPRGSQSTYSDSEVAIIGLSGRYPQSANLQTYWNNLREGRNCITEVPKERWDWRDYYSEDRTKAGAHFSKYGGFIEGVDEFDPLFFNISPREAIEMDPQERLFLEHAWMAMEDAGYTREGLQIQQDNDLAGQVGVYVGVMYGEYQLFGAEESLKGNRMGFGGNLASIANRVSYVLNLHGPSMTTDSMCSSSLTSIHLACQDLKLGRTDLAIAGGVNITIHPNKYLMLSAGQFISTKGHCESFGEGGDGYIPAEGVGSLVLKRLDEAEQDGDHIYGTILGSAINHGGKTNGYNVPNPKAQRSVIKRALQEANLDPRWVSYVEAHGTGTKLGDPIEITALSQVFGKETQDKGFCLIGSAKSNVGHCEGAAGISGLTKILLQMKHKQIVPSLHSSTLNPNIDFENTPFVVNQELRSWDRPFIEGREIPRIAGISSFGAGGSNAHLILKEYQMTEIIDAAVVSRSPVIIPLSARTPEQLLDIAKNLLSHLKESSFNQTSVNPEGADSNKLERTVQRLVSEQLDIDTSELDSTQLLEDYGFEIVHKTALLEALQEDFSMVLDAQAFMGQASIGAIVLWLLETVGSSNKALFEIKNKNQKEQHSVVTSQYMNKLAYTLQTGREAMEERLGFMVTSVQDLEQKLEAFLSGNTNIDDCYQGQVKKNKEALSVITSDDDMRETIEVWIAKKKYTKLLDLWVKGLSFDWNKLYGNIKPNRISLPTYPFAKEKYWITNSIQPASGVAFSEGGILKSYSEEENIFRNIVEEILCEKPYSSSTS